MRRVHIRDLQTTQLCLVEALAQTGNLSAAAERVGLTQSAASHALGRLRRQLHDPLFVRTSHGMRPTPSGERLAKAVTAALANLRAGIDPLPAFEPKSSRRIFNLFMSDVGQMVLLPRLLERLKAEAPEVVIRVRQVPIHAPHTMLESGEVDLAIGYFTTLTAGFFQRLLFRERYVCVAREGNAAFAKGMSLEAFAAAQHAFVDSSGMGHHRLYSILQRRNIQRNIKLYVPQFMVLPLLIARSDLVVVMPSRLAEAFARLERLSVMPLPIKVPSYEIKQYWHERYREDPANRWLRNIFIELFAD